MAIKIDDEVIKVIEIFYGVDKKLELIELFLELLLDKINLEKSIYAFLKLYFFLFLKFYITKNLNFNILQILIYF